MNQSAVIEEDKKKLPKKKISKAKKILFSIILILGFIAILEVISSILYFTRIPKEKREIYERAIEVDMTSAEVFRFKSHPYFNYICNPDYRFEDGYKPHNSKGFRQPEWNETKKPGEIRIIALGGSTTYGIFSKYGYNTWPYMVKMRLKQIYGEKIELYNLGVAAYTTHEIIGVMAMLVKTLKPDIVLLHVGANEAFTACYPAEGGPDNIFFRHSWNYQPLSDTVKFLMRKSYLLRLLLISTIFKDAHIPGGLIPAIQYPNPSTKVVLANAPNATGKYFQQNVETLITLIQSIGAIPVLINHPLNPQWEMTANEFYHWVTLAHKRNNQILEEIAFNKKIDLIDIFVLIKDIRFFVDAVHMTKTGEEKKAEHIALALAEIIKRIIANSKG